MTIEVWSLYKCPDGTAMTVSLRMDGWRYVEIRKREMEVVVEVLFLSNSDLL